jgi:hypothetical protein
MYMWEFSDVIIDSHACTRPCVFANHQFEAFRAVKLIQHIAAMICVCCRISKGLIFILNISEKYLHAVTQKGV